MLRRFRVRGSWMGGVRDLVSLVHVDLRDRADLHFVAGEGGDDVAVGDDDDSLAGVLLREASIACLARSMAASRDWESGPAGATEPWAAGAGIIWADCAGRRRAGRERRERRVADGRVAGVEPGGDRARGFAGPAGRGRHHQRDAPGQEEVGGDFGLGEAAGGELVEGIGRCIRRVREIDEGFAMTDEQDAGGRGAPAGLFAPIGAGASHGKRQQNEGGQGKAIRNGVHCLVLLEFMGSWAIACDRTNTPGAMATGLYVCIRLADRGKMPCKRTPPALAEPGAFWTCEKVGRTFGTIRPGVACVRVTGAGFGTVN